MSAFFSVAGLAFAVWVMKTNGNRSVTKGVLYFVLMEMLQVVQYSFIATDVDPSAPTLRQMQASPQCNSSANRFLTFLGLVHIAFQPYFSAHLSCAFVRSETNKAQMALVQRLQFIGGFLMLARFFASYIDGATMTRYGFDPNIAFDANKWVPSTEWLNGPALCTYRGLKHLAWSVPFAKVTYYLPAMSLHSFLMFAPFYAMDHGSTSKNVKQWVGGAVLFLTGPVLADWITPNKHEAASVWCFFSIMQVVGLALMMAIRLHSRNRWFNAEKKQA